MRRKILINTDNFVGNFGVNSNSLNSYHKSHTSSKTCEDNQPRLYKLKLTKFKVPKQSPPHTVRDLLDPPLIGWCHLWDSRGNIFLLFHSEAKGTNDRTISQQQTFASVFMLLNVYRILKEPHTRSLVNLSSKKKKKKINK